MPNWMMRAFAVFVGACVMASLLAVGTVGVSRAGEDTSLCRPSGTRVAIPSNFVIDACFDGKDLVLRNRKELVLRVNRSGSPQRGTLRPVGGVPTVASGLTAAAHSASEPDLLPPNYELRIPVSQAAGSIDIVGVKKYQQEYVLTKGIITAFGLQGPLLGAVQSFVDLNQSLDSTWTGLQACAKTARGYFGRVACDANYTRDIAIALGRFSASLVGKVQFNKAKFSVDGIRNILDTADWVNSAVGDFSAFLKGERRLAIAAGSPTPGGPDTPFPGEELWPSPVLSQTSAPAGRVVSFTVGKCPAVPAGKVQALHVTVDSGDENQGTAGGGLVYTEADGSVSGSGSLEGEGRLIFGIHAKGYGASHDPAPGVYQVNVECRVRTGDESFEESQSVRKFRPTPFRVTGPSPTLEFSTKTARVGDVIKVVPTMGCPTGSVAPEPYASIYSDGQSGGPRQLLSRGTLTVQRNGSWVQEFRVQKDAVPGRYVVVGSCSHVDARTPGQNYAYDYDNYLTILPEQSAGAVAAARTAQPTKAATTTPGPGVRSGSGTAPKSSPVLPSTTPPTPTPDS